MKFIPGLYEWRYKKKKRSNKYGRYKGTFAPASMLDLRSLIERIRGYYYGFSSRLLNNYYKLFVF